MEDKKKKRKKWPWIVLAIIGLLVALAAWFMRPPDNSIIFASKGTLERFPQFKSQYVEPRDVIVWMPLDYHNEDSVDVVYMHDGQMLFDADATWNRQEWRVDEVADSLLQAGLISPASLWAFLTPATALPSISLPRRGNMCPRPSART